VQTKDDGKRVILRVAAPSRGPADHGRLPVMWPRHTDGKMRRDGSDAASAQPHTAVDERGGLHGAPGLSAHASSRVAPGGAACVGAPLSVIYRTTEERRRWRRSSDSSHRLGRQDKSADRGRAHVVVGIEVSGNPSRRHAGARAAKASDINGPSAIARINAEGRGP
jgi:hypothetical protein